jgi:pimeloyl-ACP methyl ester carboxylesterase
MEVDAMDIRKICPTGGRPVRMVCGLLLFAVFNTGGCTALHDSRLSGQIALHSEDYSNVSVIFVEATPDFGNWGQMPQLSGNFSRSGVRAFYFDPSTHGDASTLASWIASEKSRGQRVIVVGWSYGMVCTLDAVNLLAEREICVDTIVSVDCFWLNWHRGRDLQPKNVDRVVLIYRDDARLPEGFSAPVVHRIDTCRHLAALGHQHTVDVLFRETIRLGEARD